VSVESPADMGVALDTGDAAAPDPDRPEPVDKDGDDGAAVLLSAVDRRARRHLFDFGQCHLSEFGADVGAADTAERARAVEGGDLDPRGGDGR
jgi:hypothetical protein